MDSSNDSSAARDTTFVFCNFAEPRDGYLCGRQEGHDGVHGIWTRPDGYPAWPDNAKILIGDLLKQLALTTNHFLIHDPSCVLRTRGTCDCGVDACVAENKALIKKAKQRLGME